MPLIGKLGDIEYLKHTVRVILNNAFRIIFLGAIIAVALVPVFYFVVSKRCDLLDWCFWCNLNEIPENKNYMRC